MPLSQQQQYSYSNMEAVEHWGSLEGQGLAGDRESHSVSWLSDGCVWGWEGGARGKSGSMTGVKVTKGPDRM